MCPGKLLRHTSHPKILSRHHCCCHPPQPVQIHCKLPADISRKMARLLPINNLSMRPAPMMASARPMISQQIQTCHRPPIPVSYHRIRLWILAAIIMAACQRVAPLSMPICRTMYSQRYDTASKCHNRFVVLIISNKFAFHIGVPPKESQMGRK